ncbi:prothoracicostatic peptide [Aethina tumida]|uniref:prothoracicostatic peptide n=1 Tax=Aethina tumida TaxID=116153 RepID=UPI002149711D|nr:prothoracicostatic peptide [Aethina tumida]XP_019869568.2 prothoracicostatic peptide [Aethina tumida]
MRHVSGVLVAGGQSGGGSIWLWSVVLACCLEAALLPAVVAEDIAPVAPISRSDSIDDNPQLNEISKRDWHKELKIWGKRAWNGLHGGWGKRSVPNYDDQMMPYDSPSLVEKRAWNRLQNGWGKRMAPDDELAVNQLASMFERDPQMEQPYTEFGPEAEIDGIEEEKRNWQQFNSGWGKRNNWNKMRGAWGKREPAWSNLKGMWG